MERIVELRLRNSYLERELAEARLEAKMAPLPASHNQGLRAALAGVTWAETLEEAIRIAEEALRS